MASRHSGTLMAASGVVVTVGGIFMAVTAFEPSKTPRSIWANIWFDLGFAFVILGLVILAVGLYLHFRRGTPSPSTAPEEPSADTEPDPVDWVAACYFSPPGTLTFRLDHRFDNRAAIMAFSEFRCAVTDPDDVHTEAVWRGRFFNYPGAFPDAPPVRNGTYSFTWEGRDSKGAWHQIAQKTHEVTAAAALALKLENQSWKMWQGVAWIAAVEVRITNTSGEPVRLVKFDLESDPGPGERPKLTEDQVSALVRETLKRGDAYGSSNLMRTKLHPGDSISGWFVKSAYLPFPARAGTPPCTFIVKDEIGNTYELPIPARSPQTHESQQGLTASLERLRDLAIEGRAMRTRLPPPEKRGLARIPDDLRSSFKDWTARVTAELKLWPPPWLAQFQGASVQYLSMFVTNRDCAEIEQRTKVLEEIVRALRSRAAR